MESKSSKRRVKRALRQSRAWELRVAGTGITEIARMLGISIAQASKDVSDSLKAYRQYCTEAVADAMTVDLNRLDALIEAHYEGAKTDIKEAKLLLDLISQRQRIYGYAQPTKVEVINSQPVQLIEQELKAALEAIDYGRPPLTETSSSEQKPQSAPTSPPAD